MNYCILIIFLCNLYCSLCIGILVVRRIATSILVSCKTVDSTVDGTKYGRNSSQPCRILILMILFARYLLVVSTMTPAKTQFVSILNLGALYQNAASRDFRTEDQEDSLSSHFARWLQWNSALQLALTSSMARVSTSGEPPPEEKRMKKSSDLKNTTQRPRN